MSDTPRTDAASKIPSEDQSVEGLCSAWAEFSRGLERELAETQSELEIERMRLAACGVAALGYFRGCADEYKSASLSDVLRLWEKIERMRPVVEAAIQEAKDGYALHSVVLAVRDYEAKEKP